VIDATSGSPASRAGEWAGYPKGAWLIIGVEFWERFSFYGMLSILVLFLTAAPERGGFGWSASEALALLGVYSFSMYAFPAFGGFVADRILGRRRAVAIGASCMLVGQIMLTSPVFLPELLGWWHGAPLLETLQALGLPLGRLRHLGDLDAAIAAHGAVLDPGAGVEWLRHAYLAQAVGFFAALFWLVLGNAIMKSTLVVLCGETMVANDPRREAAYAFYYQGISIGALLSGIAVGWVAQTFGWQFGFGLGAAGMTVALGSYLFFAPRWLGEIGMRPDRTASRMETAAATVAGSTPMTRAAMMRAAAVRATPSPSRRAQVLRRIGLLLVLALLLCAFSVGWFQLFGSWLLFIERDIDRTIGSFVIPVPWFTSMNAAVVSVLAPLMAAFWVRLGKRNQRVDIAQKYAFALSMVLTAHILMALVARHATAAAPAPVWVPLICLSMLAVGELVAWTATYGMVSRAAPTGYASVAMGAWYLLTLGLGGYLSGFTGQLIDSDGFAATFGVVAALMGAMCVLAILLRAPLLRLAARADVTL
jgi:POT family proton-dependent oligopeptide transporter